jgi:hypothetical protein
MTNVYLGVFPGLISGLFTGLRLAGHRSWNSGIGRLKSGCADGMEEQRRGPCAGVCRDFIKPVGFLRMAR